MQNHKTPSHVYFYPSSSLPGLFYGSIKHSHLHRIRCYLVLNQDLNVQDHYNFLLMALNPSEDKQTSCNCKRQQIGQPSPTPIFEFLPQPLTFFFFICCRVTGEVAWLAMCCNVSIANHHDFATVMELLKVTTSASTWQHCKELCTSRAVDQQELFSSELKHGMK